MQPGNASPGMRRKPGVSKLRLALVTAFGFLGGGVFAMLIGVGMLLLAKAVGADHYKPGLVAALVVWLPFTGAFGAFLTQMEDPPETASTTTP